MTLLIRNPSRRTVTIELMGLPGFDTSPAVFTLSPRAVLDLERVTAALLASLDTHQVLAFTSRR